MLRAQEVGTQAAIVPAIMKKIFLSLFAVIAAASFTQASEVQPNAVTQRAVSPGRVEFMIKRLDAVVGEEIAKSLAQPIPASALADVNAKTQPNARFAIAKDSKKSKLRSDKNS